VDGVTKEQYGQELEQNLRNLHGRLRAKRYRHQPIRRVHIPKDRGRTRPIGVSATEDKVVQGAVREVLDPVHPPAVHRALHHSTARGGLVREFERRRCVQRSVTFWVSSF